jgi:hypothetical protein
MAVRGRHLAPRLRRISRAWIIPLTLAMSLVWVSVAVASDVDVAVVDVTAPTGTVTLSPGQSATITINMSVTGNQADTATFEVYRDWTLSGGVFAGGNPQEFTVPPRGGGAPATNFTTTGTVTVASEQGAGTFTLAVGAFDITNPNTTGAKLAAGDVSNYEVTVVAPSDTTPPAITPVVTGTLGNNGWYTSDVTVSWTVVDDESAISSTSGCDPTTINSDTPGTTLTCSATSAGGTASESVTIKRDATAPEVAVTGVSDGATYILGSVPTAGCSTDDPMSGVATNATLSVTGGPVGSVTATCDGAADEAGNTGSASATYQVIYAWSGFFRPVDNLPTLNQAKAGSAIPVKFSLDGNQGLGIVAPSYPRSVSIPCDATTSVDAVEETVTAGSSSLTYDSVAGQYLYVWKTDKSWTGCRQLTVKLIDGTVHSANFKFTK